MSKKKTENESKLQIIPLGGLEQIGMNITAFRYEDSIIVVDCGLSFPDDDMLGIDLVIPDVTFLQENIDKVKGFVITHGHEDHIGALPYILHELNVPVYATRLTMGIIEHKLEEHNLLKSTRRKVVKFGQSINLGQFRVEFIRTNHSIVDAAALAIYSPAGTVVHTGDFKVDYTPVFGDPIDLQRFAEIGKKGVLAIMCDSTNAERPGFTASEKTVGRAFDNLFEEHENSRIIIATFASNVDRVQQIINTAHKCGRKVVIEGRSMVSIIDIAQRLECLQIPDDTLVDIDNIKNYPDNKTVIITTGSQGESMAALSRMASKYSIPVHGEYRHLIAQRKIAKELGIPKENIFILHSGDILELDENSAKVKGKVPAGAILVDGLGVGDVGNVVLRDRQHLAEDGIVIVVFGLDKGSGQLVSGPSIVSRGFVYVRESDKLIDDATDLVLDEVTEAFEKGVTDWGKLKNIVKEVLSDYIWKKTKRRPMIMPIIMDTNF